MAGLGTTLESELNKRTGSNMTPMNADAAIEATKAVWIAWTNADLTEGRGSPSPLFVCASRTTAERLGRGKGVHGSDCQVKPSVAYNIAGLWVAQCRLETLSLADTQQDTLIAAKEAIRSKMLQAGITEAEMAVLLETPE
jgi:hypothetical protein